MNHFISFPAFLMAMSGFIAADTLLYYFTAEKFSYTFIVAFLVILTYVLFKKEFARKDK